jgi:hypothetical protein
MKRSALKGRKLTWINGIWILIRTKTRASDRDKPQLQYIYMFVPACGPLLGAASRLGVSPGLKPISANLRKIPQRRVYPVPEGPKESSLARSAWKQEKSGPVPEGRLIGSILNGRSRRRQRRQIG